MASRFVIFVVLLTFRLRIGSARRNEKRFLLDDGSDMNEKLLQMDREIQTLKSKVQELVQYASQQGTCQCQGGSSSGSSGGPTYIRWGRKDCPSNSSEIVYTGMAGGGYYDHTGAAAEYVCLPYVPDVLEDNQNISNVPTYIYGAEYEDKYFKESVNDDVPCAVCMPTQARAVIMIPAKSQCYPGWKVEYTGKLASGYFGHKAATQYVCVDKDPQTFDAGNLDRNGKLFYGVEAECGSLRCPPYKEHAKLPCVVCSK